MVKSMMMGERMRQASEQRNAELEAALAKVRPGEMPDEITLPSGLKVKLKKPSITELMGGNPLAGEGGGSDDELLKHLKVTRG